MQKAQWRKSISTIYSQLNLGVFAVNNNLTLAKTSIKNSQELYKSFIDPKSQHYVKFHKQKRQLNSSEKKDNLKKFLSNNNFSIDSGMWKTDENLQLFAKINDIVLNFEDSKNYPNIINNIHDLIDYKSRSNIEGQLSDVFNNIVQIIH